MIEPFSAENRSRKIEEENCPCHSCLVNMAFHGCFNPKLCKTRREYEELRKIDFEA
jgi:hypothetical protein